MFDVKITWETEELVFKWQYHFLHFYFDEKGLKYISDTFQKSKGKRKIKFTTRKHGK